MESLQEVTNVLCYIRDFERLHMTGIRSNIGVHVIINILAQAYADIDWFID